MKSNGFQGKSVTLIVCNGATPPQGGGNSFAQDLANETGTLVAGANGGIVPFGSGYPGHNPSLRTDIYQGTEYVHSVKTGAWDTVGPQNQSNVRHNLPPPGPRVPPGFDPSQVKPGWAY